MSANRNQAVDFLKVFVITSVVFLHIPATYDWISWYAQIIGRLGVPICFTISGYFLYAGMQRSGLAYWKKYLCNIGRILLVWLLIYTPILIHGWPDALHAIREIICRTPAYLWFMTALFVGGWTFVLYIRNECLYWIFAIVLYILGCSGGTYIDFLGLQDFWKPYLNLFITTRNGIFLTPIFLAMGALIYQMQHEYKFNIRKKYMLMVMLVTACLYLAEVILCVTTIASSSGDRTFYMTMPLLVFMLVYIVMKSQLQTNMDTRICRDFSTFIYCAQYGFISIYLLCIRHLSSTTSNGLHCFLFVLVGSILLFYILKKLHIGRTVLSWLV